MASGTSPNDGIENPSGFKFLGIAPPIFLAAVPLSSWLCQPGGIVGKVVNGLVRTTVYVGSAGSSSNVSLGRTVPVLSAMYLFLTYGIGGASSASAVDLGTNGRDNSSRRPCINL